MKHPLQKIFKDEDGIIRFIPNKIVKFLLDTSKNNLNDLSCMPFDREDWEQFAQLIGYSVSGFGDLSYASEEVVRLADEEAEKL